MANLRDFKTIEERRLGLRLSQSDLCRAAGIAPSTYVRIKTGTVWPNTRTLRKLADGLAKCAGRFPEAGE